jgi:hypothetical protein
MSDLPLPAIGFDGNNDDDVAAEAQIDLAWRDALEWARRGDVVHLAAMLRSDITLFDNDEVRAFLADVLDGKFVRSKGKPIRRPTKTFVVDSAGRPLWADERDRERFEIAKWIHDHRSIYGKQIYEAAAKRFELNEETLRNKMRRSKNHRKTGSI